MESVTFQDIQQAAERLKGVAHVTPVVTGRQLDEASGATVFLKCENFQRVGAFKFRGAYHAILTLPPENQGRPIVTISSGNHAQGVALACRLLRREAHILMGGLTNPIKRQAVLDYGATIHEAADHLDAERKLPDLLKRLNGCYIHPFNDPAVIAGQGTVVLEFLPPSRIWTWSWRRSAEADSSPAPASQLTGSTQL
jgi:threonine dehydratase